MTARAGMILYILIIWFAISFVTNILGPLMPVLIEDFSLSLTLAGLLPFSFFLAYGIVSIPAGLIVEAKGSKPALLLAFLLNLSGALLFAAYPSYLMAVGALFIIGIGMAMLQVVINPLMRVAGGDAHFAFFSVLGQLVFALASFVSPLVFATVMRDGNLLGFRAGEPAWIALYWLFALIFAVFVLGTLFIRVPQVELGDDEKPGTLIAYRELLSDRQVWMFFLGIAAYVGTEQSIANWMSQFLLTYHEVDPAEGGAQAVASFWGWMAIGCLFGLGLLKLIDASVVLRLTTVGAIGSLLGALFADKAAALIAFPACGFFISAMFSIIFSLALNSVSRHHGAFSGILCTGILGGAVFPLAVGVMGEAFGLRTALLAVLIPLAVILAISFLAKPITRNHTINLASIINYKASKAGQ